MNVKYDSVPVTYTFEDIVGLNDDLAQARLKVAYTGQNRNGSYIGKTAFEEAVSTLAYKPVVAHYIPEKNDFGGHDGEVVETEDGDVTYVNVTEPVGVVPERTRWSFCTENESGVDHNYFIIDVILWKRQRAFELIQNKPFTKHSMEIEVLDGHMESGYYQIDSFRFLAFCLLGDDVEPCFEGSRLQLFEANKFQESITDFMEAIRNYNLNTSLLGSDIDTERKEEVKPMEKDIETMGAEVKAEGEVAPEIETEPVVEETNSEPNAVEDFELLSNITEQIHECLSTVTVDMEWGPMVRYWYMDADLAAQMVYCFDVNDDHLYGFHYDLNGDALVIDFESRKRMKVSITEFVEGEKDPMMFVADMRDSYQRELGSMAQDNAKMGKELDDSRVMVDNLVESVAKYEAENAELAQFKQETEANQVKAEKEGLFSKWGCLIGEVEAFTALRSDMDKYDVSYLEKELKCIFADTKANFSLKSSDVSKEKKMNRIPVGNVGASTETEAYGGLYAKYGVKPIRD